MTDLERLDEGLRSRRTVGVTMASEAVIIDAARAYRDLLANGQRVEAQTLLQSGWFVQVPESGEYIVIPALSVYPKEAENDDDDVFERDLRDD